MVTCCDRVSRARLRVPPTAGVVLACRPVRSSTGDAGSSRPQPPVKVKLARSRSPIGGPPGAGPTDGVAPGLPAAEVGAAEASGERPAPPPESPAPESQPASRTQASAAAV